jgi:hypothetical protein
MCLKMMRGEVRMPNLSAPEFDEAFEALRSRAAEHVDNLVDAFGRPENASIRWVLVELLGESRSEKALPVFVEALRSNDHELWSWAIQGLSRLDTPDARRILREARRKEAQYETALLPELFYEFLVHCPRCDDCALVVPLPIDGVGEQADGSPRRTYPVRSAWEPRRLVCQRCGFTSDWYASGENHKRGLLIGAEYDWYFHRPLWLQISCCGEILWAYNGKHLDFLEEFVGAELRGSHPGPLASKLPAWLQSAKNRDEILGCIRKLRETLPT